MQTKKLAAEDVEGQTEQVMKNLGAVLEAAGSSFQQVVKTTVLLADMSDFGAVNAIYGESQMAVALNFAGPSIEEMITLRLTSSQRIRKK